MCRLSLRDHLGRCGVTAGARAQLGSDGDYQSLVYHPEEKQKVHQVMKVNFLLLKGWFLIAATDWVI